METTLDEAIDNGPNQRLQLFLVQPGLVQLICACAIEECLPAICPTRHWGLINEGPRRIPKRSISNTSSRTAGPNEAAAEVWDAR
jgi:hypothetical protein